MLRDSSSRKRKIELPVDSYAKPILYSLEQQRILIIVGETGSGKSTRIPQILYNSGAYNHINSDDQISNQQICITQPRRVAAIQIAQRVADELNCNLGSIVGYAIRFKETISEDTRIKFMTEGLLLREMMFDPLLKKYSVIMLDEVHERNLNTDILLGLLKCVMLKRKNLRLIICSATLDIKGVMEFFKFNEITSDTTLKEPKILLIEGKTYPVKICYRKDPVPNYLDASIKTAIDIHELNRLASGKILIFLTGQDEVEYVCEKLNDYNQVSSNRLDLRKLLVLPLHASLKPEEISRAFDEHGRNTRLCIVSTNIAEASLTIDDVAFVIDCGFTKLKVYNHKSGMNSLVRVPISKSSARQRAGRAGRTRAGVVYRLYSEEEYECLRNDTVPEIQRSSLAETLMMLKALGVSNYQKFPLVSRMPRENIIAALELLYALEAIDDSGALTRSGDTMTRFNLDPKLSKILVSHDSTSCTLDVCRIAAMLQVKDIFRKSGKYISDLWLEPNLTKICASEGDLPSYLNIFNSFLNNKKSQKWAEKRNLNYQALLNATEICSKLENQLRKCGISLTSSSGRLEALQRSLVSGLFSNAAYLHPCGDYKTVRGDQTVYIHPTSVFSEIVDRPKYVVFVEVLNTTKLYIRHIMAIEAEWLLNAAPHFYTFATNLEMGRHR